VVGLVMALGVIAFFLFYYFLISFLPHPVRMLCESMALASFLGADGRALFQTNL